MSISHLDRLRIAGTTAKYVAPWARATEATITKDFFH